MHTTTASSLVAIAQYFWRIRTSLFFVYQQKFNIEAVNDYPPIRFEIWIWIIAADLIRDSIRTEISDSQVPTIYSYLHQIIIRTSLVSTQQLFTRAAEIVCNDVYISCFNSTTIH